MFVLICALSVSLTVDLTVLNELVECLELMCMIMDLFSTTNKHLTRYHLVNNHFISLFITLGSKVIVELAQFILDLCKMMKLAKGTRNSQQRGNNDTKR